jgi:hypothetical protein
MAVDPLHPTYVLLTSLLGVASYPRQGDSKNFCHLKALHCEVDHTYV